MCVLMSFSSQSGAVCICGDPIRHQPSGGGAAEARPTGLSHGADGHHSVHQRLAPRAADARRDIHKPAHPTGQALIPR